MPVFNNILAGAAGSAGGADEEVRRSLRFDSAGSSSLYRQVTTKGDTKKFTWAGWVKRGRLNHGAQNIFSGSTGTDQGSYLCFPDNNSNALGSPDTICFKCDNGAGGGSVETQSVLRDPAAWYHVCLAVNTQAGSGSDRVRIFVNGVEQDLTGTASPHWPNYDSELSINDVGHAAIGAEANGSNSAFRFFGDFLLADVHFLDGIAPGVSTDTNGSVTRQPGAKYLTDFVEWDTTTGILIPKKYSGDYGTNGYHLMFGDDTSASTLGKDSSPKGNDFTANNLVAQGGVQLSGARSAAVSFDGVNDKISFPSNTDLNPGTTFTLECFVYRIGEGYGSEATVYYGTSAGHAGFRVLSNGKLGVERINTAFDLQTTSTVPTGEWVHVAWTKTGNTLKGWINGVHAGTATNNTQNYSGTFQTGSSLSDFSNMVISDLHLVKGTALYTSNFTPPTSISAHANTKLLCYQSNTNATATTVAPSGVTLTASSSPTAGAYPLSLDSDIDSLIDCPVNYDADTGNNGGNYCVLNQLTTTGGNSTESNGVISNGNLRATNGSSWDVETGSIGVQSGKWYYEYVVGGTITNFLGGWADPKEVNYGDAVGNTARSYGYYNTGNARNANNNTSFAASYTAGDVIGCAIDIDNRKIYWSKNGSWQAHDPNSSSGSVFTIQDPVANKFFYTPAVSTYDSGSYVDCNFGQRPFKYPPGGTGGPPAAFKALCTQNLDDSAITNSSEHFEAVAYAADSPAGATVPNSEQHGLDFSPDLVWAKSATNSDGHYLWNTTRGTTKYLSSHNNNQEGTQSGLTAFGTNGWTFGSWGALRNSTQAVWSWNAGTTDAATDTTGGVDVTLKTNTAAKFSIGVYSYNLNNDGNNTVAHGLGVIPDLVLRKDLDIGDAWSVYHSAQTFTKRATLSSGDAFSGTSTFGSASATASFNRVNNMNSGTYIDFSFAAVPGFSAFGYYVGNSKLNFNFCGFQPRWIMIKNATSTNYTSYTGWAIFDTARTPNNVSVKSLFANKSQTDGLRGNGSSASAPDYGIDILSNGFALRDNGASEINLNNETYVFAAFAEHPFKIARAR